ncbi:hypothetical protein KBJ94_29510 [Pseudomonas sp. ITA]|uniref:hypothetical protein n=1 Tax=Pseudomonas sp. ITA TaxID=2825841 RepID=UPI002498845F|nr:hypothetical protein [Pseudomonas sp. ITA]MDI2146189.1 hypothetical protein [Pseudomonas sp. ITA]
MKAPHGFNGQNVSTTVGLPVAGLDQRQQSVSEHNVIHPGEKTLAASLLAFSGVLKATRHIWFM